MIRRSIFILPSVNRSAELPLCHSLLRSDRYAAMLRENGFSFFFLSVKFAIPAAVAKLVDALL
jgi:hypothetical protein